MPDVGGGGVDGGRGPSRARAGARGPGAGGGRARTSGRRDCFRRRGAQARAWEPRRRGDPRPLGAAGGGVIRGAGKTQRRCGEGVVSSRRLKFSYSSLDYANRTPTQEGSRLGAWTAGD